MEEIKKIKIKNINDLLFIKGEWEKIENGNEMTAFQKFSWNVLLYEKWKSDIINRMFSKCFVYMYIIDNTIKMIIPIIIKNKTFKDDVLEFRKGIYFLGDNTQSDYLSSIYSEFDKKAFEKIVECLKKDFSGYNFYLNKIRADSSIAKYFENNNIKFQLSSPSVHIKIQESQDLYDCSLSKSVKQNLRTAKNRIKKADLDYELEIIKHSIDNQTIEMLLDMHRKRVEIIRQREYVSLTQKYRKRLYKLYKLCDAQEKKYDIIFNSMSKLENSVFIIVKLNGRIVGYLYGLKEEKAIRIIHNCFDEEYSFYSPMFRGTYDFIIAECNNHKNHIEELDFTLGDEGYKFKLGGTELPVYTYII